MANPVLIPALLESEIRVDDREFLARFEAAAIPSDEWKHRDHIRVAFLYLSQRPFDAALDAIRKGIRRLNRANDVPEGPTMGYHETVTVAWACLVAVTIAAHRPVDPSSAAFLEANPHLLAKTLLRLYYTRDRILTADAKARFVAPDLAPLPRAPGAVLSGEE
jgi:hypothetical protein